MNIILSYKIDWHENIPVETYARSVKFYLEQLGHTVNSIGEGHPVSNIDKLLPADLILEIECGRNKQGKYNYIVPGYARKNELKTAVWFIDSHNPDNASLHKSIMNEYNHVFFAVWSRRDVFAKHPSAHFLPSATDLRWFGKSNFKDIAYTDYNFGFFGSKKGLERADKLKELCIQYGWSYNIRQMNSNIKHRWPFTGREMSKCKILFNRSQKHDINQRVFESMAVERPLICDLDLTSGITKLFEPNKHFIPYELSNSNLEEAMRWTLNNPKEAKEIAIAAYEEIYERHTISHRVNTILETVK